MTAKKKITVTATLNIPVTKAWKVYTTPKDIMKWNCASEDWHSPSAKHDLKKGGKFIYRMEAKDKSAGFDFGGTFTDIKTNKLIAYTMGDQRTALVRFAVKGNRTKVTVTFEAEQTNPLRMQKQGWQSILNNFKKYAQTSLVEE